MKNRHLQLVLASMGAVMALAAFVLGLDTSLPAAQAAPLETGVVVQQEAQPDPAVAGDALTYTLRISNAEVFALNAIITNVLPAHVEPTGVLTWSVVIASEDIWTEEVTVQVERGYAGVLDNVVEVTTAEGPSGTYTCSVPSMVPVAAPLLAEGFEGEFPPPGWERFAYAHLNYGWHQTDVPTYVHKGGGAAFQDDWTYDVKSWLVTPRFTPTVGSELVFWQYEHYSDYYYSHSLWISSGSPDPKENDFTLLTDLGPGAEETWEKVRIAVGAFAGQPIHVGFRYEGRFEALWADEWAIDDVRVTAGLALINDGPTPAGRPTTLTATVGSGSEVRYTWNFGDGRPVVETFTPSVRTVYTEAGAYTAIVTAYNSVSAVTATTVVTVQNVVYLPLVVGNFVAAPDLVVDQIDAGDPVRVVIENRGGVAVGADSPFWVDLYIDPTVIPTHVNQAWDSVGSWGAVWAIPAAALPLAPHVPMTLTVGDRYYQPSLSNVPVPIPSGSLLYAQVDSAGPAEYGGVLETHELMGWAYNNIGGPKPPPTSSIAIDRKSRTRPP
jgi:hypothetical protein